MAWHASRMASHVPGPRFLSPAAAAIATVIPLPLAVM